MMIKMQVRVTPTFFLYRGGQMVKSVCGINEDNLTKAIKRILADGALDSVDAALQSVDAAPQEL